MSTGVRARQVAILLYPGVQSLDVTGPLEVFAAADRVARETGRQGYEITLLAAEAGPLQTSSGMSIVPDAVLARTPAPLDTLIVPGGSGGRTVASEPATLRWVARCAGRARRTASVCTGAFVLARAGLLDGRRATTHWAFAQRLAREHPAVTVEPDPIFVRDGSIWTSAGVTAGIDLALALVEEDLDRESALQIARHLVMFLRRPGSQAQFSATLAAQQPEREPLCEVQRLVVEELAGDHSVEAMAARAHMSPRNFARAFRAETGLTPARYVERVRLESARRLLEDGRQPIASIATACGFSSPETMRRVFLRGLSVGPAEYRRRFHGGAHDSHAA
ncbi:MAG TPA: GlxA family transcriptional regulator [Solirubrobacteraceae bacterium]|jgi:transcriptional regulator GlxA family with amidase domain|nr:GlxA family transcriptional regulator [Solirubrobacteraceae bacterium]